MEGKAHAKNLWLDRYGNITLSGNNLGRFRDIKCAGCFIFCQELSTPLSACPRRLCKNTNCFKTASIESIRSMKCYCNKHVHYRRRLIALENEARDREEQDNLMNDFHSDDEDDSHNHEGNDHQNNHPYPALAPPVDDLTHYINALLTHNLQIIPGKNLLIYLFLCNELL